MKETQTSLVHAANLTAHRGNTTNGVERIGSGYRVQIFAWYSTAKSVCEWRLASLDISSSNPPGKTCCPATFTIYCVCLSLNVIILYVLYCAISSYTLIILSKMKSRDEIIITCCNTLLTGVQDFKPINVPHKSVSHSNVSCVLLMITHILPITI